MTKQNIKYIKKLIKQRFSNDLKFSNIYIGESTHFYPAVFWLVSFPVYIEKSGSEKLIELLRLMNEHSQSYSLGYGTFEGYFTEEELSSLCNKLILQEA